MRWMKRIMVCFIVGIGMTVAVSVLMSMWGGTAVFNAHATAEARRTWWRDHPDSDVWLHGVFQRSGVRITVFDDDEHLNATPAEYMATWAAGWPRPALSATVRHISRTGRPAPGSTPEITGGLMRHKQQPLGAVAATGPTIAMFTMPLVIPCRPIWTGFITNTLIFGLLLLLLWFVGTVIRQHWRIMRQRCPHCGYLVGVSPNCSECGARLPPRLVPPNAR